MTMSARVSLPDLLTLTTGWVFFPDSPENMITLTEHIVQRDLNPFTLPDAIDDAKAHVVAKMPWLAGVKVPGWMMQEPTNLKLLCWIDQQELKHGTHYVVESMPRDTWRPPQRGIGEIRYVCPDGQIHQAEYEDLPDEIQAYLRDQGIVPD